MTSMADKMKKRENEQKNDGQSMKNLDAYATLHQQGKNDLVKSMNNMREEMDAAEERATSCPHAHLFQEDSVENDRLRGIENIAKIQELVWQQDQVYKTIMLKVYEPGQKDERKTNSRATSREAGPKLTPYPLEETNTVRENYACNVANQIARKNAREQQLDRNKATIHVQKVKYHRAMLDKHDMMDVKAAKRLQEMKDSQMEKTFVAQQRRNEQQKMLKEIQRSQDHQFELLQLKHHPTGGASASHNKLPPVASATPPGTDGEPAARMSRSASEPIFKDISESHRLYINTLDKWRTIEYDNEKRTEAYWRKMGATKRADTKCKAAKEHFKNAAHSISKIRTFAKAAGSTMGGTDDGTGSLGGFEGIDTEHLTNRTFESDDYFSGLQATIKASSSTDSLAASRKEYAARLERVKSYHLDLEQQGLDKLQKDKEYLEEKQRLGREFQQGKANRAGDGVKAWEIRSDASRVAREKAAIQNDGDCFIKMEAAGVRLDDLESKIDRNRSEMTSTNVLNQQTIKTAADKHEEDKKDVFREKQSEKNERGAELLEVRQKFQAHKAALGSAELAAEFLAKQQATVQAFQKQTKEDINKKDARNANAVARLARQPTEPMVREHSVSMSRMKLQRSDKGRDDPDRVLSKELWLPPELALPPHLLLSPKSSGTPAAKMLDSESASPSALSGASPAGTSGIDALEQQIMDVVARKTVGIATNKTASSMLNSSGGMASSDANLGASAGGSSHQSGGSEASDGEESEGELQFISDLKTQSSKWLQQMRKGNDD